MGMNQKTAFKILGLGPGASLAQAKKVFRELAKQYHPDLYAIEKIGAIQAEARIERMKQINQAFHFLAPLLAASDALAGNRPLKDNSVPGNTDFSFFEIFRRLKQRFGFKFHTKTGVKPSPFVKPVAPNRAGQTARFDDILHALHPGPTACVDKKPKGCRRVSRVQPHANFMKYMDIKKKIDARTRKVEEQNFSRIEPIRPVTRVKSIGGQ